MSDGEQHFSDRFGYRPPDAEIAIREDAPQPIRDGVLMLGYSVGISVGDMRDVVCGVLLRRPDPGNWSPGNIENEVGHLIDEAPWFKIYDLAEQLSGWLLQKDTVANGNSSLKQG